MSIGTLFAFIIVSGAVWILRRTDPDTPRPFRAPFIHVVSAMGILVNGYMMFSLGRENWTRLGIWLVHRARDLFRVRSAAFAAARGGAGKAKPVSDRVQMGFTDVPSRSLYQSGAGPLVVLAVASAGWVFDVYEGQLFTIFKTPMFTELTGGGPAAVEWQGNVGFAVFLLGGAAGGLFFAMLADRFGRARMMAVTILVYSVFSSATALAQSALQVHLLRFLVALGTGGEWAIAAALVAETFPAHCARERRAFFTRRA